jgi:hypothetical protein
MNTLRGYKLFELFPAMTSLASFAFLVMTFAISRRFFAAVLVMFASGLVMAAHLLHAYLTFALAWWLVLNGIGLALWRGPEVITSPRRCAAAGPSLAGVTPWEVTEVGRGAWNRSPLPKDAEGRPGSGPRASD